jgi:hypothetical protein
MVSNISRQCVGLQNAQVIWHLLPDHKPFSKPKNSKNWTRAIPVSPTNNKRWQSQRTSAVNVYNSIISEIFLNQSVTESTGKNLKNCSFHNKWST